MFVSKKDFNTINVFTNEINDLKESRKFFDKEIERIDSKITAILKYLKCEYVEEVVEGNDKILFYRERINKYLRKIKKTNNK